MEIIRGFFRRTGVAILILIIGIFLISSKLGVEKFAEFLSPSFQSSSDDDLLKKYRQSTNRYWYEEYSLVPAKTDEEAINSERYSEKYYHDKKYIDPKKETINITLSIVCFILFLYILIRVTLNFNRLFLIERLGVNIQDYFTNIISFFKSRKAEMEFLRYKRLYENGIISEEEFSAKKKELKQKIIG